MMNPRYFSDRCIDSLIAFKELDKGAAFVDDRNAVVDAIQVLQRAPKFLVPYAGEIFPDDINPKDFHDVLRMPYDEMVIEYDARSAEFSSGDRIRSENATKRIVIARAGTLDDPPIRLPKSAFAHVEEDSRIPFFDDDLGHNGIIKNIRESGFVAVQCILHMDKVGMWMLCPMSLAICPQAKFRPIRVRSGDAKKGHVYVPDFRPIRSMPGYVDEMLKDGQTHVSDLIMDVLEETVPLTQLLLSLATMNNLSTVVPAPHKLNKKRAKKNKRPLPEYTIISLPGYTASQDGSHNAGYGPGGRRSPRMHRRRGHLRRWRDEDGTVIKVKWISDMVVNKGKVPVKQAYKVEKQR